MQLTAYLRGKFIWMLSAVEENRDFIPAKGKRSVLWIYWLENKTNNTVMLQACLWWQCVQYVVTFQLEPSNWREKAFRSKESLQKEAASLFWWRTSKNFNCIASNTNFWKLSSKLTRLIVDMMALDRQPLSFVENRGFRSLMAEVEPRYIIPSRTLLRDRFIPQVYNEVSFMFLISRSKLMWETFFKCIVAMLSHLIFGLHELPLHF